MSKTVPFTEEGVKKYLDQAITHWRLCDAPSEEMRSHYVDAFQSVRISLFGELLPPEPVAEADPELSETAE